MSHVRSVAVGIWVKRGSRHEEPEQSGVSHLIEHMLFKGTKNRTAEALAAEVDSIGGHMDAFTAKESAAFHLKVLDENLPLAVDILADLVMNPLFDPEEMAKEKKVVFEEINMVEDSPDDLVMELFSGAFWRDHPLGRPILGTKHSVESLTRLDLESRFRDTFQPGNMVIAVAGHLEHGQVLDLVSRQLGTLGAGGGSADGGAPTPMAGIVTRSKKELEQVHVCIGCRAYPQDHADRYGVYVLNTVLGGSISSRLFQNVRERRGLAYSISSGVTSYSDTGGLSVYAGTSLASLDEVVGLTVDELRQLRREPVPRAELRRAKDHLKGSLMLSLEGTGSRMSHLARQELCFGRQVSIDEILAGLEAVEERDVRRIANDLFSSELTMSLLGNLEGYEPDPARLRV
jgi:predicted Zn-dependent peptidase